jgi:hypothetical protein
MRARKVNNQSDHIRAIRPSHSTLSNNKMSVSLETLGADVLLDVVLWLSRLDLLHFVMVVSPLHSNTPPPLHIPASTAS